MSVRLPPRTPLSVQVFNFSRHFLTTSSVQILYYALGIHHWIRHCPLLNGWMNENASLALTQAYHRGFELQKIVGIKSKSVSLAFKTFYNLVLILSSLHTLLAPNREHLKELLSVRSHTYIILETVSQDSF